jgi:hypothetical protein
VAKARAILGAAFSIVSLLGHLFILWLSLGWRVRRTRKAFEKELIKGGMSKEDAKRLSAHYKILKDQIISTVTHSFSDL